MNTLFVEPAATVQLYLGTHEPHWLASSTVPLFISRTRAVRRPWTPKGKGPWVMDSGGFTELHKHGRYSFTVESYGSDLDRFHAAVPLDWAAPMDFMCEATALKNTGLSVLDHQIRTIGNYLRLRELTDVPIAPVLQGWDLDEYLRHVEMYAYAGVDLEAAVAVGVGSVCRRGQDAAIIRILRRLARDHRNLHAFGVRSSALDACADVLQSADSMAWSFAGRSRPNPAHVHPRGARGCANCKLFAHEWHAATIARIGRNREEIAA